MNFKLLLAVLKTKCKSFGNRAFNKAGHLLWNSLPNSIRHHRPLKIKKKELKTFLFKLTYEQKPLIYFSITDLLFSFVKFLMIFYCNIFDYFLILFFYFNVNSA